MTPVDRADTGRLFTIARRTYDTIPVLRLVSEVRYDLFTNAVANRLSYRRYDTTIFGRISTIAYISIFDAIDEIASKRQKFRRKSCFCY